jgi:hypothetical protein
MKAVLAMAGLIALSAMGLDQPANEVKVTLSGMK